jgi:hypothetical protein
MSIEKTPGGFTGFDMTCDICGKTIYLDFERDDFIGAIREAKQSGWRITKIADDWEHYCPACVDKGLDRECLIS